MRLPGAEGRGRGLERSTLCGGVDGGQECIRPACVVARVVLGAVAASGLATAPPPDPPPRRLQSRLNQRADLGAAELPDVYVMSRGWLGAAQVMAQGQDLTCDCADASCRGGH